MRKLVEFSKKHELAIRFIIALFVSLLFMAGSFLWGSYRYETNDDETMNFIAAGAYGKEYSQYLIFSNIIYGYLLKGLYYIFPNINCYLAMMLGLDVLAFTFLTIALAKQFTIEGLFTVSVLINALLTPRFYSELQFTKNASLYAIVGFFVYLMYVKDEPDRKTYNRRMRLIGMVFMILSVLVRWQCFFLNLPIAGITYLLLCLHMLAEKDDWKECVHLRELICIVAIVMVLLGIQRLAYSSEEWKEYQRYYTVLARVQDYGELQFDSNQENVGVQQSEIDMLKRWDWADTDRFTIQHLCEIAEAKGITYNGSVSVKHIWYKMLETNTYGIYIWLTVAILAVTLTKNKLLFIQQLFFGLLLFCYFGFFAHLYRITNRVTLGIWVSVVLFTIGLSVLYLPKKYEVGWAACCLSVIVIVVALGVNYRYYDVEKGKQIVEKVSSTSLVLNTMKTYEDSVFFLDSLSFLTEKTDNLIVLDTRYQDYFDNIFMLGGWLVHSPVVNSKYERSGIRNPFETMLQNENAYYVGDMESLETIKNYYSDIYEKQIEAQTVAEINQIYIWKLSER